MAKKLARAGIIAFVAAIAVFFIFGALTPAITAEIPRLVGTVSDRSTAVGISGATVVLAGPTILATTKTETSGNYGFIVNPSPYEHTLTVSATGYITQTRTVFLVNGVLRVDIALSCSAGCENPPPPSQALLSGVVVTTGSLPVQGATVTVKNIATAVVIGTSSTNVEGRFSISVKTFENYEVSVSAPGFHTETRFVHIEASDVSVSFGLLAEGAVPVFAVCQTFPVFGEVCLQPSAWTTIQSVLAIIGGIIIFVIVARTGGKS